DRALDRGGHHHRVQLRGGRRVIVDVDVAGAARVADRGRDLDQARVVAAERRVDLHGDDTAPIAEVALELSILELCDGGGGAAIVSPAPPSLSSADSAAWGPDPLFAPTAATPRRDSSSAACRAVTPPSVCASSSNVSSATIGSDETFRTDSIAVRSSSRSKNV